METVVDITPMALPQIPVRVRQAVSGDLPFIDRLQKMHSKQVGWMPTKSLEQKIAAGNVSIAESVGSRQKAVGSEETSPLPTAYCLPPTPLAYCISQDQYFKRDDVGIVYQMNVLPGHQRSLVAATMLRDVFDRAAYGCRLFCCWCAQDIAANRFWEAMGFVPLAFRVGGRTKGQGNRIHIFWQRRIRAGDTSTPFWFPSETKGGSIREDRLVFPIPPGLRWDDVMPQVLREVSVPDGSAECRVRSTEKRKALPASKSSTPYSALRTQHSPSRALSGWSFAPPPAPPMTAIAKPPRKPRVRVKNDKAKAAMARELRDRWLERVNSTALGGGAKYEIGRVGVGMRDHILDDLARTRRITMAA